jgi:hypothetical protein
MRAPLSVDGPGAKGVDLWVREGRPAEIAS